MNVGEGLRRLGVVLGVVGSVIGILSGYDSARAVWNIHVAHQRFGSLMASPTMLRVAKDVKDQAATLNNLAADPDFLKLSDAERKYVLGRVVNKGVASPAVPSTVPTGEPHLATSEPLPGASPPGDLYIVKSEPLPGRQGDVMDVLVNLDEFREVLVDKSGQISSVVLSTGESIPKTEPPTLMAFMALLLYPLGGFLAPWGAIRALAWLVAGFLSK